MKAVLVIDMPEHCYECPLVNYKHCNANYFVRRNHGGNIPYNFSNEYIHEQGRQTWCPLKPLPEKKEHEEEIDYDYGYIDGWNDCISTMSGEEENNGLRPLKDDSHEYYGCPSCLHIVSSVQNYCENCGQKLDWRNVEDIE